MAEPEFAPALAALAERIGLGAVTNLRRLSGGASQETWAFDAGGASRILRRGASASGSGLAVGLATEAALMQRARAAGVPSPKVLHVLEEADGVGAGFVQDFVSGETLGGRIVRDARFADVRPKLAFQCGQILARIHAIPISEVPPLPHRPARETLQGFIDLHKTEAWPRPVFSLAFKWLEKRLPEKEDVALCHGDFRNGNLIIDETGVAAVLDWEIALIGDPMQDLGWVCTAAWRFGGDQPVGGFGAKADLFAGYESVSGTRVDPERVRFWEMLGSLRWGIMCTMSTIRFRSGGDHAVDRPMIARRASENELDLVNLMMGA